MPIRSGDSRAGDREDRQGPRRRRAFRQPLDDLPEAEPSTETELAAIVEGSTDAIFRKTLDGIVTSWNAGARAMYGYRPDEVVGNHVSMLAPADRKREIDEILERLSRGEPIRNFRTKRVTKDGRTIDVWLSISPVRDARGRIVGAATIARDVTEQVRLEAELQLALQRLTIITRASADGITIQDAAGRLVYANDAAAHLSGYADAEAFLSAPPTEVLSRFELRAEDGSPFPLEALPGRRVLLGEPEAEALIRVRARGEHLETWRRVRSSPMLDASGRIVNVVNVFHDVTLQKRIEDELRFRTVLLEAESEASDEGILVSDTSGAVVSWNRRLLEVLGLGEQDVANRSREDVYEAMRPSLVRADEVIARAHDLWGRPAEESREEIAFTDGRLVERFSRPLRDDRGRFYGRVSFFRDVTEDRKREREQRFLADSTRELVSSLDYEAVLQRIAALAVPQLADWCSVDVVDLDGSIRLIAVAHVEPSKAQWAYELRKRFPVDPTAAQGLPNVIRTGVSEHRPVITMEEMEALAGDDAELQEIVHELRITSYMIVPLIARGRTLGGMTFVWAETGRSYGEDDLVLAEELAARAALALDNARLYRERDQIAQTLQQSLLPGPLPAVDGLRVATRYRAAGEGVEVGGDFFDVFDAGGGAYAFVIGDVCGKGPKAAALMGAARHTIRTAAMEERRPSDVLRVLNAALHQRLADQWFCTVAYVRARRAADGARLTICCGGHPLPAVVRGDRTVEFAGRPGTLLGVFPEVELFDAVVDLRPGDTFVLYTDGVTDEQREGEEFGLDRLVDVLRRTAGRDPDEVAGAIEEAVSSFRPQPPGDDIALVVAKVVDA